MAKGSSIARTFSTNPDSFAACHGIRRQSKQIRIVAFTIMQTLQQQLILLVESAALSGGAASWRFLLHHAGSGATTSACDIEPQCSSNRAVVLALVRGLEAIDSTGQVTLITGSRYVKRAIGRELAQWKRSGWHWERFGRRVPVRNADLWQRVDRALEFHTVRCHAWQSLPSVSATEQVVPDDAAWVPFAADVPADAPVSQRAFAKPQVAAYEVDPAVVVVRKQRGRYTKLRDAACDAVRHVGQQFNDLLDNPLVRAG